MAAAGLWLQTVAVRDALGVGLPVNDDVTSANLQQKLDVRPVELRRAAGGAGITQVFAGNDAKQVCTCVAGAVADSARACGPCLLASLG